MGHLVAFSTLFLLISAIFSLPTSESNGFKTSGFLSQNSTLFSREDRPPGVPLNSIPGSAFTDNWGRDAAIAAAPVWLFPINNRKSGCYPESAVDVDSNGQKMNPGTAVPLVEPGDDCTDPGEFIGQFTRSKPFPNYVDAHYCPEKDQWRMLYHIYYVHDGSGGPSDATGHRHDWEYSMVLWKRDPGSVNWWHRDAFALSKHGDTETRGYGDIESVDYYTGDVDKTDQVYKAHPKVYAGFWKHANFFSKKTSYEAYISTDDEYRSDDYFFMAEADNIRPVTEIGGTWQYGKATNPRSYSTEAVCKM